MSGKVKRRYVENVYNILQGMMKKYVNREEMISNSIIEEMCIKVVDGYTIIRAPDYIRYVHDEYWYIIPELNVFFISTIRNTEDAYSQLTTGIQGQAYILTIDQ